MARLNLLLVMAVAFCVLPGACSPASDVPVPVHAVADDSFDGKKVEVAEGGDLTVTLGCDTRIGMEWDLKSISDQEVLKLTGQKFKPFEDETAEDMNGREVWSFEALSGGEATILMDYRQPWQTRYPPEDTFTLDVVVR
jgi:predicted secreted protein